MKIRWQLAAVSDLSDIRTYISEENPAAAEAVTKRILRSVDRLQSFPNSGRIGVVPGTREVVVPGLPYIVLYVHDDEEVEIISVFHGAQGR